MYFKAFIRAYAECLLNCSINFSFKLGFFIIFYDISPKNLFESNIDKIICIRQETDNHSHCKHKGFKLKL